MHQNLLFRKFQPEKRLPKIIGELFRVKIRYIVKMVNYTIFRCSKILGEPSKQEILRNILK